MKLSELIEKLQRFNCEAFKDKEITHAFLSSGLYTYIEDIEDIAFDTENDRFVLLTDEPKQARWDYKKLILGEK